MVHEAYKYIAKNADKAVLFIHGIVGTPNHFRDFLPWIPANVSVWNMLLDGHGGTAGDFSKTSMKKWEEQVHAAVTELSAIHREVYIVGHSMGTLLAVSEGCQGDKVRGLFLIAVPLRVAVKPRMFINAWKVGFGKIREKDTAAVAARNSCGVQPDRNIFSYIGWIPRYLELFGKIRKTRKLLPSLKIPAVAVQSARDEMVSRRSAELLKKHPGITVAELKTAGHYDYPQEDKKQLMKHFAQWVLHMEINTKSIDL